MFLRYASNQVRFHPFSQTSAHTHTLTHSVGSFSSPQSHRGSHTHTLTQTRTSYTPPLASGAHGFCIFLITVQYSLCSMCTREFLLQYGVQNWSSLHKLYTSETRVQWNTFCRGLDQVFPGNNGVESRWSCRCPHLPDERGSTEYTLSQSQTRESKWRRREGGRRTDRGRELYVRRESKEYFRRRDDWIWIPYWICCDIAMKKDRKKGGKGGGQGWDKHSSLIGKLLGFFRAVSLLYSWKIRNFQ